MSAPPNKKVRNLPHPPLAVNLPHHAARRREGPPTLLHGDDRC